MTDQQFQQFAGSIAQVMAQQVAATFSQQQQAQQAQQAQQTPVQPPQVQGAHKMSELCKKVEVCEGKDFQNWKFRLLSHIKSVDHRVSTMMKTLETSTAPYNLENANPEEKAVGAEIYALLVEKTRGEPFNIVRNVVTECGFEAFRLLCARFDPKSLGKRIQLMRKVINHPRIKGPSDGQ